MRHYPSLPEIVAAVEALLRPRRKKAPQGRKPRYSDERIIALAVYQHLWRFRYAQDLLYWLRTHGHQVPAPATFCERKAQLLGQVILAVKALAGLYNPAPCLRMDSKKLPTARTFMDCAYTRWWMTRAFYDGGCSVRPMSMMSRWPRGCYRGWAMWWSREIRAI